MKKQLFFIIFIALTFINANALIGHSYTSGKGGSLDLLPCLPESDQVRDFFVSHKPDYAVELVYPLPLDADVPVNWKDLYLRFRSISRLEEITYFSERIHKYKKMFNKAYLIRSADNRKRISDFENGKALENVTVYALLDEVVLGKGVYRIDYNLGKEYLGITLHNVTPLSRIINIVDEGNLYIKFIFYKSNGVLQAYMFGAYTFENKPIVNSILKYPWSTLSKRVYTIFAKLVDGYAGLNIDSGFPEELRQ